MLFGHDEGKNIRQLCDGLKDLICVKMGGTGKESHTVNAVLTGNGEDAVNNVATANGAFYATAANGAPKFGTLPIAQGGTGKTTALEALLALGGIQFKKLWKNASPSSNFAAQTLAIDWKSYDFLVVHFRHYLTANYSTTQIIKTSDTFKSGFLNSTLPQMNAYLYLYGRSYELVDAGIKFTAGYNHDTNSYTPVEGNQYAVPLVIYGIKGVL